MTTKNTTVYLKNYQPYPFIVNTVNLEFDLYDDHVIVRNCMQLERRAAGELCLWGGDLELLSLMLDDKPLSPHAYQCLPDRLIIPHCPDVCTLSTEVRIYPQNNTQLSGLYRSQKLFCTQCEAEGFRRITYFPDRPDVLSVYTTTIRADKTHYPVLLSNGNPIDAGQSDDGRHWVTWHDPFLKPSYLFALVAGNLVCIRDQFTTCSGKNVDLNLYVEPGQEDKCEHAMLSLKRAMKWDEEHYGREYDLDIFMIVAVSDFNMGAMENKGLNIFNSKYILARPDTATDQDYVNIERVVAHEYFHNWTGNRVTCRDWFQLSLKEGLTVFRDQEFCRDMYSREVKRIQDVKELRSIQFPEDAGFMAHPVQPASYQEINNFYTATIYNKGAEVIRMQQTLVGIEGFRHGMDLYFQRYDGQAVTINDFVASMEHANAIDLTQFKRWYAQAGTPEVHVTEDYHDQRLTLTFQQHCRPTPECQKKLPFHIPVRVALFNSDGTHLPLENSVLELRDEEQSFHFDGLASKPVVSLLRDFSAPIVLHRKINLDEQLFLLQHETDGFAQWDAAQNLLMHCIHACYHSDTEQWTIPSSLMTALERVFLDQKLHPALRAELLTPPRFEEVANTLSLVDVARVEAIRDFLHQALGRALLTSAHTLYQTLWEQEDHSMKAQIFGQRRLRNQCLWLMFHGDEANYVSLCEQQFKQSLTMTDKIASLALLVNSPSDARERALTAFYQTWQHDDLVLDKWFTLQATCQLPQTLEHVRHLLNHPAFNLKNPNKVRALIGAFTQNPRHFHAIDGQGYAFLTDTLITLDKINSQISARLSQPLTQWQKFDVPRQTLMKQQLKRLEMLELSRDLREIVEKSLHHDE